MMYKRIVLGSLVLILMAGLIFGLCILSCLAQEESITITTYYPSPYGSYNELRAKKMGIGDTYYQGTVSITDPADLIVEGIVGIGTTSPDYKLDVNGDLNLRTSKLRVNGSLGIDGQVLTSTGSSVAWENPGGFSECEIVTCSCGAGQGIGLLGYCDCTATCPADKWLIAGGFDEPEQHGGRLKSYPQTSGLGGSWYVEGQARDEPPLRGYALCCK